MQPLKIVIPGNFWDVQIYRDRLYLWDMEGSLSTYNWEESLEALFTQNQENKLPILCAFSQGDYLYGEKFKLIFEDADFKELLSNKFTRLSSIFEINLELRGQQNNPFRELHTDSEIYDNKLYAITDTGLWSTGAHKSGTGNPVSSRPKKVWDCNLQSIRAHSNRLALSGGSDGLFEFRINGDDIYQSGFSKIDSNITQLSNRHSLYSTWAFSSIFNTSDVDTSFLVGNYWSNDGLERRLNNGKIYELSDIFDDVMPYGFSWAENEKIYYAQDGQIKIVRFNQQNTASDSDNSPFNSISSENIESIVAENILMADTAKFGAIIEDFNGLTVLRSDGEHYRIDGCITRWRIYPRSKRYENHLHVILDDRIEIYSFNHDYFVEQRTKKFGIEHKEQVAFRGSR
jgi:hypothetical protein